MTKLNVVRPLQRADIMAVENDLAAKLIPALLDFIVFDHDDDKVDVIEEVVEVVILVRDDVLFDKGIIDLQGFGQVPLLTFKQLQGRGPAP